MVKEYPPILMEADMKEDGVEDSSMGKDDSHGQIIRSIMEIIRSGRKTVKVLSLIHQEKPTKEAGLRENNKGKEYFLVLQVKF